MRRPCIAARIVGAWSASCLLLVTAVAQPAADVAAEPVVSTYVGSGARGFDGDGGDRRNASLVFPVALAWDLNGNLLYLDMGRDIGGRLRRINSATGIIETVAGGGMREPNGVLASEASLPAVPWGLAVDSSGNIFIGSEGAGIVSRIEAKSGQITRFAGGGESLESGIEPTTARLWKPMSVRVDDHDNVYIVDGGLHAVFRVNAKDGLVRLIAGTPGKAGFDGDGGPATEALLNWPTDLSLDEKGNIYIADRNNHVIRKVRVRDGFISTFSGAPISPGFAGDGDDRLQARFRYPHNLLLDDDTLLVGDLLNHRVRKIDLATGEVGTVAGNGKATYEGENVPALRAGLFEPAFLLKHPAGGLLVAAERSRRIYFIGDRVEIPVPWWRRWWAIITYVSGFVLLTVGVVQLRTRAVRKRLAELEAAVSSRSRMLEERKSLAEQQTTELGEMISAKDELMARISHEFRTPLTVILGPIERLLQETTAAPIRSYLEITKRNSSRLLRLVDTLLDLARLQSGHAAPTTPIAPEPIVKWVIASFESLAADRGVKIELGAMENCIFQSNAETVETIVINLLSNALRFTPPGGIVQISLEETMGMGQLMVKDNGSGFTETRLDGLFEPLEPASIAKNSGLGIDLGLTIIRQAVSAHGGTVEIQSKPGSGSTFRVLMPLASSNAVPPSQEHLLTNTKDVPIDETLVPKPVQRASGTTQADPYRSTILVVEDNDDMGDYLLQLLSPLYTCVLAVDGDEGVEIATETIPDLVVCDVMLPGRDGYEVCRALKSNDFTSHVPVILLTALQDLEQKLRGFEERADDYLTKPFDEVELLSRIANLLEIRALLQRRYARQLRIEPTQPAEENPRDRAFLEKLASVCDERHSDPQLNVEALASALALSDRQLQRKVKALIGLTPVEYLREYRLKRAHDALLNGRRASDTAIAVGFGSHAYFSSCFKAFFGYTPDETRENSLSGR